MARARYRSKRSYDDLFERRILPALEKGSGRTLRQVVGEVAAKEGVDPVRLYPPMWRRMNARRNEAESKEPNQPTE